MRIRITEKCIYEYNRPYVYSIEVHLSTIIILFIYLKRGPGFDSRRFQIFWEAAGLELGPLSLVRTTEELIEGKSSGSGLENPQKLELLRQQAAVARSV
jgi:hypothetical protein